MKKLLSIALATASIAACLSFVGCGGEATVNYTLSEDGTYYIVSSVSGNKNALTSYQIPATYSEQEGGKQLPVTVIGENAFYQCRKLRSVTIPDSVTEIGTRSFAMSGITQIEIPDSVETIGYMAFAMCNYLDEVVIPSSVTHLGDAAFYECQELQRAEVYANITVLKGGTFYNTVKVVGGNAYYHQLTQVVLPASLEKIASSALEGNALTDIYYTGTEEQWNDLYFYTFQEKENNKPNAEPEYEEVKVEKNKCIPSTTTIHFNYVPEK